MSYVYFIKGSGKEVKIGVTKDIDKRVSTLRTGSPTIEVLFYIEDESYRELESHFHEMFESKHVSGEWYALTSDDINSIKQTYDAKPYSKDTSAPIRRQVLRESKVVSLNLEVLTIEILQEQCDKEGISLSNLTRKIFKQYIKDNELE